MFMNQGVNSPNDMDSTDSQITIGSNSRDQGNHEPSHSIKVKESVIKDEESVTLINQTESITNVELNVQTKPKKRKDKSFKSEFLESVFQEQTQNDQGKAKRSKARDEPINEKQVFFNKVEKNKLNQYCLFNKERKYGDKKSSMHSSLMKVSSDSKMST